MPKVHLYSLESGKSTEVTDGWYASGSPAFSADGKYLFFVSARDFNPIYSSTEWNHAYRDMSRIYFVTLAKATPNPLRPKLDDDPEPKKEDKKDGPVEVKVDLEGLAGASSRCPAPRRTIADSRPRATRCTTSARATGSPQQLYVFDFGSKKETALGNVSGYEISADGKKMLVQQAGKYGIIDLPKGPINIGEALNLSALEVSLDKRAEWKQMFHECWRQMRDFFYDPGLHGVDWVAVRKKYEPLVEHVAHRADLTYVIGEMISELNAGHAYIGGGELPEVREGAAGLARRGVQARRARPASSRSRAFCPARTGIRERRSPLTEVGVNVSEKEWIVAINGRPTSEVKNINELLVNAAGKPVVLSVNAKPAAEGARRVVVTPTNDEGDLYYYAWVQGNIKKVSDATDGKVGYIHIPDMQQTGLNEFAKHFYPQLKKQALIVDVRGNGGGNVSPQIIERLRREAAMIGIARNAEPTIEPREHVRRADGVPAQRVLGLRRRHLLVPVPALQTRAAHRQAELGRRGRHSRFAAAAGRRVAEQAGVLALRPRRQGVDHGERRRVAGHRGGQRPGEGVRGRRSAVEQGDRGAARGVEEEPAEGADPAAVPEAVTRHEGASRGPPGGLFRRSGGRRRVF